MRREAMHEKQTNRPGWPEVIVGLAVLVVVGFGGGIAIARLHLGQTITGLIFTALSGVAGIAGFAAAMALGRHRDFGLRRVSGRWLMIGAGMGVLAFLVKILATMAFTRLVGAQTNVQQIYAEGASGGMAFAVLATIGLAGLTPLGEDLLFRGVVTNMLLRFGSVVGVLGGGIVFALFHGFNAVLPAALIVGIGASELFRRTQSVWPGVVLHMMFNVPTIPLMLLAS